MKRFSNRHNESPKLMIIPMIDIIFFLLVFFMLTTIYAVPQQSMHINLPKTKSAQTHELKPIIIDMDVEGNLVLEQKKVKVTGLNELLKPYVDKNPQQSFLIRADAKVPYGDVVELMDEMKVSGVKNVSIATTRK